MTEIKYTKLPWHIFQDREGFLNGIEGGNGKSVAIFDQSGLTPNDAAFIVKCVNNHEKLLEALGDVVTQYRATHGGAVPAWIRNAEQTIRDCEYE